MKTSMNVATVACHIATRNVFKHHWGFEIEALHHNVSTWSFEVMSILVRLLQLVAQSLPSTWLA